jgi:hypothetical protein
MAQPDPRDGRPQPNGQRRLLTKILIGVVSFWVAFGISTLLPKDEKPEMAWSIGASLFVAGVVFIAHYLFEVERKLDALLQSFDDTRKQLGNQVRLHAEATEHQLREGFSKIHLAEEIFGLREASQLDAEEMMQIAKLVRNRTKITSEAPQLIQDFALAEMSRLVEYLKQMGDSNDLTYEGEDQDWLLGLTKVARSEIQATSLSTVDAGGRGFIDGGLWSTDFGQRYLDFQRHAIRTREVRVQRLFILDRKGLNIEDLHQILRMHLSIGVEVRTLDATVAPTLHTRLHDFILFDRKLSYQTTTASSLDSQLNPIIVNITLVTDPERVNRRISEFADLWSAEGVQAVTLDEHGELAFRPAKTVDQVRLAKSVDRRHRGPHPGPAGEAA